MNDYLGSDSVTPESLSSKHTPGPWVIGETRAKGQEVWIDTNTSDPRLTYSRWSGLAVAYGCDEQRIAGAEVAMANARLIAAAPDMLEALKAADWYIGQLELLVYSANDTGTHASRAQVQAAIAKATA